MRPHRAPQSGHQARWQGCGHAACAQWKLAAAPCAAIVQNGFLHDETPGRGITLRQVPSQRAQRRVRHCFVAEHICVDVCAAAAVSSWPQSQGGALAVSGAARSCNVAQPSCRWHWRGMYAAWPAHRPTLMQARRPRSASALRTCAPHCRSRIAWKSLAPSLSSTAPLATAAPSVAGTVLTDNKV